MTQSTPHVQATRYTVNCIPEGASPDGHVFAITVEWRGHDRWAVTRHGMCLDNEGNWDYEMRPSEREDDWIASHRFGLDTALELAKSEAPHVTVNGFTVEEALAMYAAEVAE